MIKLLTEDQWPVDNIKWHNLWVIRVPERGKTRWHVNNSQIFPKFDPNLMKDFKVNNFKKLNEKVSGGSMPESYPFPS